MNPRVVWFIYLLGDPTTHIPETLRLKAKVHTFDGVTNERGKLTHVLELEANDFKTVFASIPPELVHSLTLCEWSMEELRNRTIKHDDIVIDVQKLYESSSNQVKWTISVRGGHESEPIMEAYKIYKEGYYNGAPPRLVSVESRLSEFTV